jgi:hypothetical protein
MDWELVASNNIRCTSVHVCKTCTSIHVCLSFTVKSNTENGMEAENWGLAMEVWVLVVTRFWLGDLWLEVVALASRDDSTREIQCLNLHGENSRSCFNWLCLAMNLLKALFCECGFSPGWKHKVINQGNGDACAVFPSWMRCFWR